MNAAQPRPAWPVATAAPMPTNEDLYRACLLSVCRLENMRMKGERPKPPAPKAPEPADVRLKLTRGRHSRILDIVRKTPGLTCGEIAEKMDATDRQIRERLALLSDEGQLTRYRDKANGPFRYEVAR